MMYKVIFFLLLFSPNTSFSQNTIALPDVLNFYKGVYNAGLQNWDIKQDRNGIIYIANNEGLLSFDGRYWKIYPLPNRTNVRSIAIGDDNRIYVGGQDEFGFFAPTSNGSLAFHSLVSLIPTKDRAFADVWDIVIYKDDVFVRTSNRIFQVKGDKVNVFYAFSGWNCLAECKGRLYAHDTKKGLMTFENSFFSDLPFANIIDAEVTAILPLQNDSIMVTSLKNGIYILTSNNFTKLQPTDQSFPEGNRIFTAVKINSEWIALATNTSGVYIIDAKGRFIQGFSKTEGLQNNNVLSIFPDKQQNLWLGLDNGIDFIAYNSAVKQINPFQQDGSGYAAIIYNNRLYAGTSGNLFSVLLQPVADLSFSRGEFAPVGNTQGQTWSLAEINSKLILSHHEGAFLLGENDAKNFYPFLGFWNFNRDTDQNTVVAGTYNGLTIFKDSNNILIHPESIPGFAETSRYVEIDKMNTIWVSHPYHGVYKVSKDASGKYLSKIYTQQNGLPSTLNNHVFKLKDEVIIATVSGVYDYNPETDRFEPSVYYKNLLGNQSVRYVKEDGEGNIWFIHDKSLGIVDMTGEKPSIIYFPELNNRILSGFEFIYPYNKNNIFVGGERGLLLINYEKYKQTVKELQVQLRSVRILDKQDSLVFGGYFNNLNEQQVQSKQQVHEFSSHWKTIHFEFASPLFAQQANLEYSIRLKGFNDSWSEWNNKTEKEFSNLPPGNYTFEVKVRNNFGNESAPAAYAFKILPPWYFSFAAFCFYALALLAGFYFVAKWQGRKFEQQQLKYEEEQKRLQYLHQLELNKTASELVALRNEKLEAEINFKNTELASSAMHLVKKGELLTKIKSELNHVMKGSESPQAISEVKKMIKSLTEDDNMDREWENFSRHFDKVHSDFGRVLKDRHPGITNNEMKLSTYLRMNLSTKEIAQLMNISVRGVEIGRYRLRKKLAIPTEMTLFDYFMSVKSKDEG